MIFIGTMILLLALGHGTKSEESVLEIGEMGSGEADTQTTTAPTVFLIDENGDIPTALTNMTEPSENITAQADTELVIGLNGEEYKGNESVTLMTNITDDVMTEEPSTFPTDTAIVVTNETMTTMSPTNVSPTETTTVSDSTTTTMAIPVTSTTSTTEIPTTAFAEVSTVSTKQTTTTSTKQTSSTTTSTSTTTASGKTEKSPSRVPQRQQDEEKNVCVFLDPDFKCNRELICFGEGEIDCETDDNQFIMDKISLSSSTSEDYGDDEVLDSDTIGTFPPNLVGVGTPKKISFYNMQSFATTDMQEGETSEAVENSSPTEAAETLATMRVNFPTDVEKTSETINNNCSVGVGENGETAKNCSTAPAATIESTSTIGSSENSKLNGEPEDSVSKTTTSTHDPTEEGFTTIAASENTEETIFQSTSVKILFPKLSAMPSKTNESDETMTSPGTQESDVESNTKSEEAVEKMERLRRKRGFSSSNADQTPETKEKLAVEYLQRKYLINPTCRLSGNIECLPVPTTATCRGKTFCQAVRRKSETAESSKAKGMEIWMIVVIVICGCFGFMTIGMITYLIIHSCKKLKVQPTHDVTPLNYITKKAENTETA